MSNIADRTIPIHFIDMKHHLIQLFLLVALVVAGCGKADFRKASVDELTLSSSYTGENYLIQILLPDEYSENNAYPIVYLLDGHFHFNELGEEIVGMIQDGEIQDVIIAGIAYADYPFEGKASNLDNLSTIYQVRETDLLFPKDTLDDGRELGGGGLEFYRFLREELAPVVESSYSVDTLNRTLLGHSYGGYFTLFQMFNYADAPFFKNLGALSPVVWYGNENLFYMEEALSITNASLPVDLYLGVGELEGVIFNASFDAFVEDLAEDQIPGLTYKAERYSGSHTFSANTGFINALKYFYE